MKGKNTQPPSSLKTLSNPIPLTKQSQLSRSKEYSYFSQQA